MLGLTERSFSDSAQPLPPSTEAQLLEIVRDLQASTPDAPLKLRDITQWFADRYGGEYDRKVTPRWVGSVLRKKLQLRPYKSHGAFVISVAERSKLDRLFEKYGLGTGEGDRTAGEPEASAPEGALGG